MRKAHTMNDSVIALMMSRLTKYDGSDLGVELKCSDFPSLPQTLQEVSSSSLTNPNHLELW